MVAGAKRAPGAAANGRRQVLHELSLALLEAPTVDRVAALTVAAAAGHLRGEATWLAELDGVPGRLVVSATAGGGRRAVEALRSVPLDGPSRAAHGGTAGELLWLGTPEQVTARLPELAAALPGTAAAVLQPLSPPGRGHAVAVLGMCFEEPRPWRGDDAEFLTALGELAGSAICAARARQAHAGFAGPAAGAADRARRVGQLAAALVSAVSVEEVVAVLAEHVQYAVGCDAFSLRRVLADRGIASAMRLGGRTIGYRGRFADVPLDVAGALAEAVSTRTAVFIESAAEHRRRYGRHGVDGYEQARIEGLARLPLAVEGELLAIMSVGYCGPQVFPAEQRLFLTTMADLAAQALGRALRTQRLRQLQSVSDLALAHTSLPELIADISGRLTTVLPAAQAQLYLHDARRRVLLPAVGRPGVAVPVGQGVLAHALHGRRAVAVDEAVAAELVRLDPALDRFGSLAVLPLPIGAAVVGVLVAARDQSVPFRGAELEVLDMVAGRVALAVDRARVFETQRELARTLQAALLPAMLPMIPGMAGAARYAAAGAGVDAGGDFYDVFALDDDQWLAVIGDVRGRGPAAAAITGLIRHTVQAVAAEEQNPAAILARLNAVVYADTGPEDFATVACVRIRPGRGQAVLTIASAGHCPPLILRAGAADALQAVETSGALVGAFADFTAADEVCTLAAGDVLLLHTDGLTEAAGAHGRYGESRLAAQLRGLAGHPVDDIVTAVHDAVLAHCDGSCDDDLAILAFTVAPTAAGEPDLLLELVLAPGAGAVGQARRGLAGLPSAEPGTDLLADLELVVSELVTNAVRHGYAGTDVTLQITRNGGCLRVEVGNIGDPFPARVHASEPASPLAEHGRGLLIVTGIADRTGFHRDGDRVTVWCEFSTDRAPAAGGGPRRSTGG